MKFNTKVVEVPTKTLGLVEWEITKTEKQLLIFKDGSLPKCRSHKENSLNYLFNFSKEKRDKFKKSVELTDTIKDA